MQFRACACCTPMGIAHVCGSPPGTPPLIPTIGHCTRVRFTARHPPLIPTIAGARALAELSHTSARLRLPLSAPSAESCWRFKHWTPRRASRSGVVAPDAAMPWCVRVCQRAARPSPKHATSNRVFVIRADKGGVLSAFCDYACTAPARTGKGILPVYAFTMHSEPRRPRRGAVKRL